MLGDERAVRHAAVVVVLRFEFLQIVSDVRVIADDTLPDTNRSRVISLCMPSQSAFRSAVIAWMRCLPDTARCMTSSPRVCYGMGHAFG